MIGIQIAGVLFGLFMIYITFVYSKKKEFTAKEWVFWSILWIAFIFVAVYPNAMDFIIKGVFKLQRPLDFFIIIGFMFLIGAVFYTYTLVRKNQKKIESVVREIALREK